MSYSVREANVKVAILERPQTQLQSGDDAHPFHILQNARTTLVAGPGLLPAAAAK